MHTMVDTFLAILNILKINQYLVDKTSLSAHTSFLSMPTNLKFPVFVLAVNISLFTNLLLVQTVQWYTTQLYSNNCSCS